MSIAIYREVEVVLVREPNGWGRADIRLPSGPIAFECPSEGIAITKAKDLIDKYHREPLDSADD